MQPPPSLSPTTGASLPARLKATTGRAQTISPRPYLCTLRCRRSPTTEFRHAATILTAPFPSLRLEVEGPFPRSHTIYPLHFLRHVSLSIYYVFFLLFFLLSVCPSLFVTYGHVFPHFVHLFHLQYFISSTMFLYFYTCTVRVSMACSFGIQSSFVYSSDTLALDIDRAHER
ncbi:hypothetical protein DEU56DRAFT_520791 [Suillus clintonianus]|uniref:uncharacterized protein n=1 Tax=Suillus clintonianus TaxID=1904413 RepID=UPI001B86C4A1|nr:uncharacterized protein DEU56DRAFT_520791 [Suillus clintonianus]KAG2152899.1 hypothetical protein DEU56DRAFT_520791 [Suillus clintonianus]